MVVVVVVVFQGDGLSDRLRWLGGAERHSL